MDIIRGIVYYLGYIYGTPEQISETDMNKCISVIKKVNVDDKNTLNEELLEYFKKKNIRVD